MAKIYPEFRLLGVRDKSLPRISKGFIQQDATGQVSDWNTLPMFGGVSLEEVVKEGVRTERESSRHDDHDVTVKLTLTNLPRDVVNNLGRVKRSGRLAFRKVAISYILQTGLKVLARFASLDARPPKRHMEFDRYWERVIFRNPPTTQRTINADPKISQVVLSMSVREARSLEGLRKAMDVPQSTVCVAALVAGLSQSISWVPNTDAERYALQIQRFADWLEDG